MVIHLAVVSVGLLENEGAKECAISLDLTASLEGMADRKDFKTSNNLEEFKLPSTRYSL